MSAFIVADETLDIIVTNLKNRKQVKFNKKPVIGCHMDQPNANNKLGQKLLNMNACAVDGRYPDNTDNITQLYHYQDIEVSKMQFLKSLQCFVYQCCEDPVVNSPEYKELQELTGEIAMEIVDDMPEYKIASWG
jgi:hypothetical protein